MKRIFVLSVLCLLIFSACSDEEVKPAGVLTVNESNYDLDYGSIYDCGTNDDLTYRRYQIAFKDEDKNSPSSYLSFFINSNSTTRLEEGIYNYNYTPEEGEFDYTKVGVNIKYDSKGEAISGQILKENTCTFKGTVVITKADGNYNFKVDLIATKDGIEYTIKADFNEALVEEWISL